MQSLLIQWFSMSLKEKVALRIKKEREIKGLSQEKLALKAGIDRTYLAGIEACKRNPTLESIEKIIKALDLSDEEFFNLSNIVDYE